MDLARKTLKPFARAAHLFFRCHLEWQIKGGVRLTLAERSAASRPPTPGERQAAREQAELALILRQLGELLDADSEIRHALRHLGFVEQGLQRQGLHGALYAVPLDVLKRAHEQFEGLVTNWEPRGLASLRSKMAVAVLDRESRDEATDTGPARPDQPPPSPKRRAAPA
jgi:hypothetical protein